MMMEIDVLHSGIQQARDNGSMLRQQQRLGAHIPQQRLVSTVL